MLTMFDAKTEITQSILEREKQPFKLSELYDDLGKKGINDKKMILDVLSELYENGLIERTEIENDIWGYESNFLNN